MLATQFHEAAAGARNSAALDETARLLWRAHAEGHLDDAEADGVSQAIQVRRSAFATGRALPPSPSRPVLGLRRPARRPPRSPDRRASLERRRRQAASGAMPPQLAARFTPGEQAVLAVVAREMQKRQVCVLPVDAIAALAGVCSRLAQSAMRAAEAIGLILIRERRRPGMPSLTNVVTVVSKEWLGWLRRGPGGGGCKTLHPTDTFSFLQGAKPQNSRHAGRQESPRRRAPDANGDFAKGGRK